MHALLSLTEGGAGFGDLYLLSRQRGRGIGDKPF
jgi:hypothetical protein